MIILLWNVQFLRISSESAVDVRDPGLYDCVYREEAFYGLTGIESRGWIPVGTKIAIRYKYDAGRWDKHANLCDLLDTGSDDMDV